MCHGIRRFACHDALRIGKLIVETYERLTIGIKPIGLCICQGVIGIMVTTLFVLCLMVDDGRGCSLLYLYLANAQVALKILHVGCGVPQTPLGKREELNSLLHVSGIANTQLLHLSPCIQWHEEKFGDLNAVLASCYAGIVESMTALIAVERGLAWFPTWVPHYVAVLYIEVTAAIVHWHVIVAVARNAAEFGIFVERVTSCRIGNKTEEFFIAQVVNPREWCFRVGNYIFTVGIVEMSVCLFHYSVCKKVN